MKIEQNVIDKLSARGSEALQPALKSGYVCPLCGSGSGKNGTGMTERNNRYTCWSCGQINGDDIFAVIGKQYNNSSFIWQVRKVGELLGVEVNVEEVDLPFGDDFRGENIAPEKKHISSLVFTEPETSDGNGVAQYCTEAAKRIGDTEYHRGISMATLEKFGVGFDPDWRMPDRPGSKGTPRLIIPIGPKTYFARDAREEIPESEKRYSKMLVGPVSFFNFDALENSDKVFFVVEGEIDALSVIDCGKNAVSLGGIGKAKEFLGRLSDINTRVAFVVALDNETEPSKKKAVERNAEVLMYGLRELGFAADICSTLYGTSKDANEAQNDHLMDFVESLNKAEEQMEKYDPSGEFSVSSIVDRYEDRIKTGKEYAEAIPTGIMEIDDILEGGIYPGLIGVGAVSSLGKTTLCLQMADNISASGKDVLFFSLEMPGTEILAKSISRMTFKQKDDSLSPMTVRQLLSKTSEWNSGTKAGVLRVIKKYRNTVQPGMHIFESDGTYTAEKICSIVRNHIRIRKRPAVVFIDYLQVISPRDIRMTDKQNVDSSIAQLKLLSNELNIPIICISSFNRENYSSPVSLASFKESGNIEYGFDLLIGLQFHGIENEDGTGVGRGEIQRLIKQNTERKSEGKGIAIDIKVLKNRTQCTGVRVMEFITRYNCWGKYVEDEYEIDVGF